jgi:hypothetical protein
MNEASQHAKGQNAKPPWKSRRLASMGHHTKHHLQVNLQRHPGARFAATNRLTQVKWGSLQIA